MRALLPIFLILMLSLGELTGCTSREDDSSRESKLDRATALIDQGNYDRAIEILTDLQKTDDTAQVAMVLASAYAGRAGIKVENYWGFVVGYEALLKSDESSQEESSVVTEQLRWILRWKKRVEKIPIVSKDKFHDLQEGVKTLKTTETKGAHLYRAVLELVLLRSVIEDLSVKVSTLSQKTDACDATAAALVPWLDFSQGTLANLLTDLSEAYPDDKADFQAAKSAVTSLAIPSTEQLCGSGS